MKHFDIISIFPRALDSYFNESILKRAQEKKLIKISTHDLRKYTTDKHHKVDDRVYGGGAGMVMKVEPIYRALKALLRHSPLATRHSQKVRTILLAANGKMFTQKDAVRLSKYDRLVFICGRYEGVDARVEKFIDEKISIGAYVLTGGELPAAIIIDAVSRNIPRVVGKEESVQNESYSQAVRKAGRKNLMTLSLHDSLPYLEHDHYTRPEVFEVGKKKFSVPKVLLSGNHKSIVEWRKKSSKET